MVQADVTPVAQPQRIGKPGDPCVMVIFGAAGDLTRRKLVPALYNLAKYELLSREFAIVGVAHNPMSTDDFRKKVADDLKEFVGSNLDSDLSEWFLRRLQYVTADFGDQSVYPKLKELLAQVDKDHSTHGNYFFYLATSADFFGPIVEQLAAVGLTQEDNQHWRRVIIEKPFGRDLDSAKALNKQLLRVIDEKQIYRIDHYLGKETVQNILAFRFANGIFEPIWNRRYIDHVQISVAETVGVEQRGGYYDQAGALRDMVPNHIMQLISLTAMEPPISFQADAVRDEQAKILHAIQPLSSEEVLTRTVRGQYGEGVIAGQRRAGVSRGNGRPPRFPDRNLCRHETADRQLALGRRSLLPAHGKTNAGAQHSHCDPVPARTVCLVPRHSRREPDAEPVGLTYPTGGGHLTAVCGQGSGAGDATGRG